MRGVRKRWSRIWPQRVPLKVRVRGLAHICAFTRSTRAQQSAVSQCMALHTWGRTCSTILMQPLNRGNEKKTNAKRGEREKEQEKAREREKERISGWRAYFRASRTSVRGIEGSTASWYAYKVYFTKSRIQQWKLYNYDFKFDDYFYLVTVSR